MQEILALSGEMPASGTWLLRGALLQAALLLFQSVTYFGIETFEGPPHDVSVPLDRMIPFQPAWVFVYILWFPLIAAFPLALLYWGTPLYPAYIFAILADIVISLAIYYVYPTSFKRPEAPDTFAGRTLKLVYQGSYRGLNCAPSMHCSMCYLVIWYALQCPAMPVLLRILFILVAALIVISTMTTRQHVLVDALSALPLAALCVVIGTWLSGAVGERLLALIVG